MTDKASSVYFCTGCGDCCRWPGYVKVTEDDVDHIANHLSIPVEDFLNDYTYLTADRKSLSIINNDKGHCHFFDDDANSCKIYDVRPSQCIGFPNKWQFENWRKECPAIELKYLLKKK